MAKFEKGKPNPGRKFQPGQSGNPKGPPKAIVEVATAARERTVEAIKTLEAIMLVGGKGTRLRPLTLSAPKPLLPTAGLPFLAHQLARAAECGITHVVLATSYRAEMFTEAFGDGSQFGLSIDYEYEAEPHPAFHHPHSFCTQLLPLHGMLFRAVAIRR